MSAVTGNKVFFLPDPNTTQSLDSPGEISFEPRPIEISAPKMTHPLPITYLSRLVNWIWDNVSPLFNWLIPRKKVSATPLPSNQIADAIKHAPPQATSKAQLLKAALIVSLTAATLLYNREILIDGGSKAAHYVFQNPARLIFAGTLSTQLVNRTLFYINPPLINKGRVEWKFDHFRVLKIGAAALAAIGVGAAMYTATNDGIEDHSLLEQAGNCTASLFQSTMDGVDRLWSNPFFQTPFSLPIPFTQFAPKISLPFMLPLNLVCSISNKLAYSLLPTSLKHPILFATGITMRYASTATTWRVPVTLVQWCWALISPKQTV